MVLKLFCLMYPFTMCENVIPPPPTPSLSSVMSVSRVVVCWKINIPKICGLNPPSLPLLSKKPTLCTVWELLLPEGQLNIGRINRGWKPPKRKILNSISKQRKLTCFYKPLPLFALLQTASRQLEDVNISDVRLLVWESILFHPGCWHRTINPRVCERESVLCPVAEGKSVFNFWVL